MAFIGNTNTTQAFTPAIDYFSGNASTTAFTLSRPVASVAQVQVVVNNVAQNPSDAYTVSGNTITFTSAPSSGTNNIYVYYTSPITQVIAPGQGTVTTTSLASSTGSGAVVLGTSPTINSPVTAGTPTGVGVLTSGTVQASTSGTSIDFTGIPSWAKRITLMFQGVSTNGTSNIQIQLGDSGGIETTGYLGDGFSTAGGGVANSNYTSGFGIGITNQAAASLSHGNFTITNLSGNIWTIFGALAQSTSATMNFTAGSKELSATLDRLRITTVNGTDVFDLGSINILYE